MEQLLAKLTNLSYEVLGVLLPGIIFLMLLVFWWASLGGLAPFISDGFFPQLTSSNAAEIVESISVQTGIGIAAPAVLAAYFLGHLLHWIGRSGTTADAVVKNHLKRTLNSLIFAIPKPSRSFDESLDPLYQRLQSKFASGVTISWAQFFPIARTYLFRNLSHSMVVTYQNKYTLHRSITAASAATFWLCAAALAGGGLAAYTHGEAPRWALLVSLTAFCLVLVWGYSDSYAYNWKLFGNTIVTESYSLLFGTPDEKC